MSQSSTQGPFLALPAFSQPAQNGCSIVAASSSSKGLHLPARNTPTKKRKPNPNAKPTQGGRKKNKSGVNDSRELDERDDVDEEDLLAAPDDAADIGEGVREMDENYDEDEEEGMPVDGDDAVVPEEGDVEATTTDGVRSVAAARAPARGGKKHVLLDVDMEGVKARGKAMKGDQV
jgi:transcription initiation factor TFIID subunit 11